MDKKSEDFCSDCNSRRGFLSTAGKLLAGGAFAAAGILGGDRWLQGKVAPEFRPLDGKETDDILRQGPQPDDSPELQRAIQERDLDWIHANLKATNDGPGKAAAICGYCYYQYQNRTSDGSCQSHGGCTTRCWRRLVCYDGACNISYGAWVALNCCPC